MSQAAAVPVPDGEAARFAAPDRPAVVYVDDEPNNLAAFQACFKPLYRVVTCRGGAAALEVLRSRTDLGVLITDQRMPGMSGIELLEQVRLEFPDIQRMIVTANCDMKTMIAAVNRGQISRYFLKPWSHDELNAALEDGLMIFELRQRIREIQLRMIASERLAAIGQVSAGIAHELMTPLTCLTQNLARLRTRLDEVAAYARAQLCHAPDRAVSEALDELPGLFEDTAQGGQHIHQLAHSVQLQARGEEDHDHSDLAEVVQLTARIARVEVRGRAEMTIRGEPVRVRGGQVRLTQVLLNLIINAVQAMEGLDRRGRIALGWEDHGQKEIRAWVKDNGGGIPADLQQKVFKPLFTTKPVGVGTGLGLSICRELIEGMGGRIALHSAVGEGTTIELFLQRTLPVVQDRFT